MVDVMFSIRWTVLSKNRWWRWCSHNERTSLVTFRMRSSLSFSHIFNVMRLCECVTFVVYKSFISFLIESRPKLSNVIALEVKVMAISDIFSPVLLQLLNRILTEFRHFFWNGFIFCINLQNICCRNAGPSNENVQRVANSFKRIFLLNNEQSSYTVSVVLQSCRMSYRF